jgi:signal transduction histidine kinase
MFGPLLSSQSIFYGIILTLVFTFSKSAGGILFGIALWTVSRHISKTSVVRDYMIISAFGLVILFTSNQASVLLTASYPPFGLAATSFVGLSSYLVLVGIYSSAISVAQDTKLRQTIRQSAVEEAKLLVSIGSAQMEQEIQRKVLYVAKQQEESLTEETGIHASLTENDMRSYLSKVLEEIQVLKNVDEILIKGKDILEQSTKFLVCSKLGQIRLVYNNYFDLYEKVMYKYTKAEHEGIRLVTSIDRTSVEIVRKFLDIGIQIRHVKNMPPIDFAVSDKEMVATIEKTESSQMIQNLLVSSEKPYIDHFASIFEELWKNGIDAKVRIKAIEEGVDSEGIEIIQDPVEIQKLGFSLIQTATEEILVIYSTANAFHRQQHAGGIQLLKEAATERGVKVRILTPGDEIIVETARKLMMVQEEAQQPYENIGIRYIQPHLQTKVTILIVDKKYSLAVELKDDTKQTSNEAIGLATYSNSQSTVLSYASIFESLWKQTELYERLKESDKIKDEFINVAAHELRTPIQPILSLTDILRSNIEDPRQQELLDVVIRNARRLQRLAEDILDITKIESRALRLTKEKANLNEIILNAISDSANPIVIESKDNRAKIEFIRSGEEGEDNAAVVEVDKGRITQVISNLLTNAIKFTKNGTIKVFLERKGNEIAVNVIDTGTGIDSEILPRLFTKFGTSSNTGTGLGLFISKSLVEAHDGKIWAANNADGKGAKFSFSLPIKK